MKKFHKVLCAILAVLMLLSAVPTAVYAAMAEGGSETIEAIIA